MKKLNNYRCPKLFIFLIIRLTLTASTSRSGLLPNKLTNKQTNYGLLASCCKALRQAEYEAHLVPNYVSVLLSWTSEASYCLKITVSYLSKGFMDDFVACCDAKHADGETAQPCSAGWSNLSLPLLLSSWSWLMRLREASQFYVIPRQRQATCNRKKLHGYLKVTRLCVTSTCSA